MKSRGNPILSLLIGMLLVFSASPAAFEVQSQAAVSLPVGETACADPYELNDSFASAWGILPGVLHSYICSPNDQDFFTFRAAKGDPIQLYLDQLPGDYNLCLYNSNYEEISCSSNAGTAPETIASAANFGVNYYARVYGVKGAFDPAQPYRLWLQLGSSPLVITSPAQVTNITSSSATIQWSTNRPSDSRVTYGTHARETGSEVYNQDPVSDHQITLTGLQPATTYYYQARSAEASGAQVSSRERYFKTIPLPDSQPPALSKMAITRTDPQSDIFQILADVSDNAEVERVEFYIDQTLVGIDHSGGSQASMFLSPSRLGIPFTQFYMGSHDVMAHVYDTSGTMFQYHLDWSALIDPAAIHMSLSPGNGYEVLAPGNSIPAGEKLRIEVVAWTDYACGWGGRPDLPIWICGDTDPTPVDQVQIYIDDVLVHTAHPDPLSFWVDYDLDISGALPSTHTIRAVASLESGTTATRTAVVSLRHADWALDVTRTVARIGNTFKVSLQLDNETTFSIPIHTLSDSLNGFQPYRTEFRVSGVANSDYTDEILCSDVTTGCSVEFDLGARDLPAGQNFTFSYWAIPILYTDRAVGHTIGEEEPVHITGGMDFSLDLNRLAARLSSGETIETGVELAQEASDYLIVTRPDVLYSLYRVDEVRSLLQTAARLASAREAVLAYLPDVLLTPGDIHSYILDWGASMRGSDGVAGHYAQNGYLLLLGEPDIVPTSDPDYELEVGESANIRYADLFYANTTGWWGNPELAVSRIIGNTAADLEIPLQTSLDTVFAHDSALAVAGAGPNTGSFERSLDDIVDILNDEFSVRSWKVQDVLDAGQDPDVKFGTDAANRDVIFYRDHCGAFSWGYDENDTVVSAGDFPDLGATHPFAFACCCQAGRFDNRGTTIAESFLQHGSVVYIGATENSKTYQNNQNCRQFFDDWVGHTNSLGMTFRNLKRNMDDTDRNTYWALEYQMYGDPKMGGGSLAAEATATAAPASPPEFLHVSVPTYTVSLDEDGYDFVSLPGGAVLAEPNQPQVPIYRVEQILPAGYQVQGVTLGSRSALSTVSGLNLFSGIEPFDSQPRQEQGPAAAGWYPTTPLHWQVEANTDGTSTLAIFVHPFFYNPATQAALFFQEHDLEITYNLSPLQLSLVETGPVENGAGSELIGTLWVQGEMPPMSEMAGQEESAGGPVVVRAWIQRDAAGSTPQGVLLRTLSGLQGTGRFELRWDAEGAEPGDYRIEAELRDMAGNLLDRTLGRFRLGQVAGQAHDLVAAPDHFFPGANVDLSFYFRNTGSVPISGTAVIEVQTAASGERLARWEDSTGLVQPGAQVPFQHSWTSPDPGSAAYRVVAYVLFDGRTTSILEAALTGPKRLYLPVVGR